jgi:hypothetical protein
VGKTNTVNFTASNNLLPYPLAIGYAEKLVKETKSIKFLGI